jgi:hypothetical protein
MIRSYKSFQMLLNDKFGQNVEEKDALGPLNPFGAVLYLFLVAFVATIILPGFR